MIKRGFTLIEILITFTIIGIAAAITLPALFKSSQNEANAARLKASVRNFETAMATMIAAEGVNNLYETTAWRVGEVNASADNSVKAGFLNSIERFITTVGYQEGENPVTAYYGGKSVYALDNSGKKGSAIDDINGCLPLIMKDGSVIFIRTFSKTTNSPNDNGYMGLQRVAFTHGTSLNGNPADIFIDVNGAKEPNTVGRDLFHFYVNSDGTLFPFGSLDVVVYHNGNETDANYWEVGCTNNNKANNGWPCTARLIEEGYKMNY